jgi:hypothetical protein
MGLVKWDQVRAQAWSLRTLAQAEFITPDGDGLKATLRRQLQANISWYDKTYADNQAANPLHFIPTNDRPYDNGMSMAPWQDDFFTWSVGYVQALGDVDASRLLLWKAAFPVNRMVNPGFCWILASSYTLRVRPAPDSVFYSDWKSVFDATWAGDTKNALLPECASREMANALKLSRTGEMLGAAQSPQGSVAFLQAALATAVDGRSPEADRAWKQYLAAPVRPAFEQSPEWAIVPYQGN